MCKNKSNPAYERDTLRIMEIWKLEESFECTALPRKGRAEELSASCCPHSKGTLESLILRPLSTHPHLEPGLPDSRVIEKLGTTHSWEETKIVKKNMKEDHAVLLRQTYMLFLLSVLLC